MGISNMSTEFEKMFMNVLSKEQSVVLACEFSCSKIIHSNPSDRLYLSWCHLSHCVLVIDFVSLPHA